MIKKLFSYIILALSFIYIPALGQDDCTLKLKEAEKLYDEGRIEKIPDLLTPCIENGFNKENKIQALRLLSLVYLFEDNPEMAEGALLQILKMNPEYKVNSSVDEVDYIRLYKLFNTAPVFSIGAHFTFNSTAPLLIEAIGANTFDSINPNYSSNGIGLGGGIKGAYHINDKIDISFEPSFHISSFGFEEMVTSVEKNNIVENYNYLSFPVFGSYGFYNLNNALFYGELGFSYNYLVSGEQKVNTIDRELPYFSTEYLRQKHNFAAIIGVGSKVYVTRSYFELSMRYSFGINNIVLPNLVNSNITENLTNAQWNYGHIDNYVRLSQFMLTISYNYEFYKHKRKR